MMRATATLLGFLLVTACNAADTTKEKKAAVQMVNAEISSEGMIRSEAMLAEATADELAKTPESAAKKLRVVSDLHIGGCWFAVPDQQKKLLDMFEGMADGSDKVDELVILGDMFEFALVPANQTTVYPTDLFSHESAYGFHVPQFVQKVKRIADQGTKIYVVRGNHDEWLNKDMLHAGFGDSVKFMEDGLSLHGVWFEHGHIPDTCCHTYFKEDGTPVLPIGYFITRLRAQAEGQCKSPGTLGPTSSKSKMEERFEQQPKALKSLERQLLQNSLENMDIHEAEQAVSFLAEKDNFLKVYLLGAVNGAMNANFEEVEHTKQVMITGADNNYIYWGDDSKKISLYDVLMEHKDDMRRNLARYGKRGTAEKFLATLTDYTHWARHDTQHEVVMVGHTHLPMLARLKRLDPKSSVSDEVSFVNTGGWVQDGAGTFRSTFVDLKLEPQYVESSLIQLDRDAGVYRPTKISVWEYPETKPRHVHEVRPQARANLVDEEESGGNALHPVEGEGYSYHFGEAAQKTKLSVFGLVFACLVGLFMQA